MDKQELKSQLKALIKNEENEEEIVEVINEIFLEKWLEDEDNELYILDTYSSNWPKMVREKVAQEIGEKYVNSPSKFSLILSLFTEEVVVDRGSSKIVREVIKKETTALDEVKETVKQLDKEKGENW